jgi:hypothetical protein
MVIPVKLVPIAATTFVATAGARSPVAIFALTFTLAAAYKAPAGAATMFTP